ncbi:helix-turn-helix transcriptional regulator [Leucobacter sp. OH1287]|uniref:helix-turn-helix domain-containing protein n=1 Tax=Leucobacter sp. OH1287 TaxID=2491049 RepID=UPI000F5F35AD|nr:helix-turn-helix transcriptional regulator [Leucobacter sp. OH1287]RRD61391.1 XRE family transcriptional regulator [Leucobacter sp. OH1287]
MDLVTAIKVELARKNMRMFQLADLLGLSRVSLSKKMNGHTEFTVGELYNLADTFGMSASGVSGQNVWHFSPSPNQAGTGQRYAAHAT